jgi:hypothetical protein
VWTEFMDMHSGGYAKVHNDAGKEVSHIFIELPEATARYYFERKFGHNPDWIACSCCGENYSVSTHATLEEATEYERSEYIYNHNGFTNKKQTIPLERYMKRDNVIIINSDEVFHDLMELPDDNKDIDIAEEVLSTE